MLPAAMALQLPIPGTKGQMMYQVTGDGNSDPDSLMQQTARSDNTGNSSAMLLSMPLAAPSLGSRKRKAYQPRNSGMDSGPCTSSAKKPMTQHPLKQPQSDPVVTPHREPNKARPVAAKRQQECAPPDTDASANPPNRACKTGTAAAADVDNTSLAASRTRRTVKPREKFDPRSFDLAVDAEDCADSRSDGSCDTVSRRQSKRRYETGPATTRQDVLSSSAALEVALPRGRLSALIPDSSSTPLALRRVSEVGRAAVSDEQRMFQEFRKLTCTAYTGVVVHCQNMKLEARVNMVSYLPQRERKISGGQIYIAYMTNPHQAAVVHDITASIMTADGIPIYHNHNTRPSANSEVALERLNYLSDLSVNKQRGSGRNIDKEGGVERRARSDADSRRRFMLSPSELKHELHQWVSHDSRWITFRSWIESVLFETKLANMCLQPKVIDEEYLRPAELALLQKHVPDFCASPGKGGSAASEALVFTHMYDTLVMDKLYDSNGVLSGYKLRRKRYRRRKPDLRSSAIKWSDDKSVRHELEEAATLEDQRRVDIAWTVVQHWLRHYDDAQQASPPLYDAVDANYYVTWAHFAQWINTLLEQTPTEVAQLREELRGVGERGATPRRGVRVRDPDLMTDKVLRLQAVYDKFRSIVAEGEEVPRSWHDAKAEHRQAFENFFAGWKPLPPSMLVPQGRKYTARLSESSNRSACGTPRHADSRRCAADTTPRGQAAARVTEAAPPPRALPERRRAPPAWRMQDTEQDAVSDPDPSPQPRESSFRSSAPRPAASPAPAHSSCSAAQPTGGATPAHMASVPPLPAAGVNISADPSLSLWALTCGLGAAVPSLSQAQGAQDSWSEAARLLPLLQMQMQQQSEAAVHSDGQHFGVQAAERLARHAQALSTASQMALSQLQARSPSTMPPPSLPNSAFQDLCPSLSSTEAFFRSSVPTSKFPTADSLLQGAQAIPEPSHNATAAFCGIEPRSSLGDSSPSSTTAGPALPTILEHPTISHLLGNPLFAVPSTTTDTGSQQSSHLSSQLPQHILERTNSQAGKLRTITIRGTALPGPKSV